MNDIIEIKYSKINEFEWILNGKLIEIDEIDDDIMKYDKYFAIFFVDYSYSLKY